MSRQRKLDFLLWLLAVVDRVRNPIVAAVNRCTTKEQLYAALRERRATAKAELDVELARKEAKLARIEQWVKSPESN